MNLKNYLESRHFMHRGISVAITAAFFAVIIAINTLVGVAADKFPTTIDLTPNKLFEISQTTIDFVKALDKPVKITVLNDENRLKNGGEYFAQVKNVIDLYGKYSSNIEVDYINLILNPAFVSDYPNIVLNQNDILLSCGHRNEVISISDLFNTRYDQNSGQTYIVSSKIEQEMTSAIMRVTSDDAVKIAVLAGHDEVYAPEFMLLLEKHGYELIQQNLVTDEIASEADMAIMMGTARDPDVQELNKLNDFLENNGKYGKTLLYAPPAMVTSMPNLDSFFAQWGIGIGDQLVVETDPRHIINNLAYFCMVEYASKDYTDNLTTNTKVLSPMGRALNVLFENQSGYEVDTMLSYSPGSCLIPNNAEPNWAPTKDMLGIRPALIRSTFNQFDNLKVMSSNVFVASSAAAFDPAAILSKSVSNAEYYLSMLSTVTHRKDVINITPKNILNNELGINQFEFYLLGGLFTVIVPLAVIVAGIVVWLRRRNQ